ncbi:MAG TPA: hypothetical protein VNZ02_14820 [Steroidobacteraceae bacterium]|nr:hypothetical protein [Steroidobacteraceae bacterium]
MSDGTILKQFCDPMLLRDMAKARTYLDDNITFAGQFEIHSNANAYITTFTQRLEMKTARAEIGFILQVPGGDHGE